MQPPPPPPPSWTPAPPYPVAGGHGMVAYPMPYGTAGQPAAVGLSVAWTPSPTAYALPPLPTSLPHVSGPQGYAASTPYAPSTPSPYGPASFSSRPPPLPRASSYSSSTSSSSSSWLSRKRGRDDPPPMSSKKSKDNEFVEARKRLQQGLATPLSDDNRGLKLLKLMGYKKGQGLGSQEEGVVKPAEVDLFQQRQGLGYIAEKREKDRQKEEEERMRKEQKALRAIQSQPSLSAYMPQRPGSEGSAPAQQAVPFDPYRPADRQPMAASASTPVPLPMPPASAGSWDVNEGTQKVERWRESLKDLLGQFFRPPSYNSPAGTFQANLITMDCRRCLHTDLPWLLGKYTRLYQSSSLCKEHVTNTKFERYYVTGKARRAILVRDGAKPVGFIVILLEPARRFRVQMPIFHIEEEYRRQGFDQAVLFLLAKMIMEGRGDFNGLTCHMVLEEEPPDPSASARAQGGPRGLVRWREMGAEVEWTDRGPMVAFTPQRLRWLHDSYRGPQVQLQPASSSS